MGFQIAHLWKAPEVNPISRKARSVPMLNPINMYGRVFSFSWLGFMLAFWAWWVSKFQTLICGVLMRYQGTLSPLY